MEIYLYFVIFVSGAIIGSFLNVVLYRLHTGKSLNGRSHCMSCGKVLTWRELFPVFSYLVQKGKCRGCHSCIPSQYLFVELLTGFSFILFVWLFSSSIFLTIVYLILISLLILIVVYDIRHTIIPDELTAIIGIVAIVLLGYEFFETRDFILTLFSIGAGISASAFFAGLWFVSKGKWIGFGDAKLALPLGIIVGIGGVFSMVVLSFWVGAIVSLTLLGINKLLKKWKTHLHFLSSPITIKSEVPFAPFLAIGFILVQLFHADIFEITYAIFFSW